MSDLQRAESLYLDLMKRVLVNWIYGDAEYRNIPFPPNLDAGLIQEAMEMGLQLMRPEPCVRQLRESGYDHPPFAHTMVGLKRLDNLQFCIEDTLANEVPGDFIETGVWRGGASIFMRAVLKAHGVTDRTVWLADSFKGLPPPDVEKYPIDAGVELHTWEFLAVSLEQVKANFELYGLLDGQVRFLKGWFRDTLPEAPIDRLAVVRLDGDLYESTMDGLINLYPKLSVGGYLIVDDYGLIPPCRKAVHDFRHKHQINDKIFEIDATGVYWRRSSGGPRY